jgi:histidinol phosphatase-like PHP family hydrolase
MATRHAWIRRRRLPALLLQSGAWVCLGTDSHAARDLQAMELAVGLAQRAWANSERILNTRPLDALLHWLNERRQRG